MRLSDLSHDSSDDEIDLDFDYWERDRLESLAEQLRIKWGNAPTPQDLADEEWEEIAEVSSLPVGVTCSLKVAVEEEFNRDLTRLDGPLMVGSGNSPESRLVCTYHRIKFILQLFSTPLDELWLADDVEYKTVVVSPHNDLDRDLPRCVEFVRQAMDGLEQGSILVCCSNGQSRSAVVAIAYWMQHCDPTHSLAAGISWYQERRAGLELDDALRDTLEKYELTAQVMDSPGKRKLMIGSPESPGKKARDQVCADIEEFKL